MAFDPSTAKPLQGGFDPSTAKPDLEAGAAFGIYPRQRATPSSPETKEAVRKASEKFADFVGLSASQEPEFSFGDVGTAGGIGAVAGAVGPKALQLVGKGLKMIPSVPTKTAGALAETLGTSLQKTPATKRVAGTTGLLAGTQASGQLAEQAGLPPIVGELGFASAAPKAGRLVTESLVGKPTLTSERSARQAEALGFKISPAQVREEQALPAYGQMFAGKENQVLANRLASRGTGKETREINEKFIKSRLDDLGSQYDDLYKGRSFRVDPSVQQSLQGLLDYEQQLGVAGVSTVKQAADTIISKLQQSPVISGDDLQRLRNAITQRARSSASRGTAHEIYDFVRRIDDAVAANNPAFKQTLADLNPKYRNTVILEDLYRTGGIEQGNISLERLGNMLRGKKDVIRRTGRDIDELGELGRNLKIRALWETAGKATSTEDLLGKVLGTGADIGSALLGTRGSTARDIQKGLLTTRPIGPGVSVPTGVVGAETVRQTSDNRQE
jgi:hypothetical protein